MSSGVQSVKRAVALLGEVSLRPAGLVDLASAAELPTSTTARLLATLVSVDALRRGDDGTYRIGPAIATLGTTDDVEPSLRAVAFPYLEELATTLDEAIGLSVLAGEDLVTVAQVDTPRPVQAENWEGSRWPLHVGRSGLALIATWDEVQVDEYAAEHPELGDLHALLAEQPTDSVWWTHGAYVEELTSAAVAIVGRGRAVAVLYAYGPSYRFPDPDQVAGIEAALLDGAARIARSWALSNRTHHAVTSNGSHHEH